MPEIVPCHTTVTTYERHLREDTARTAVRLAKRFGVKVPYQDRATDNWIEVWILKDKVERTYETDPVISEEKTRIAFTVPLQYKNIFKATYEEKPIFPPPNLPSTTATFIYDGHEWTISQHEK